MKTANYISNKLNWRTTKRRLVATVTKICSYFIFPKCILFPLSLLAFRMAAKKSRHDSTFDNNNDGLHDLNNNAVSEEKCLSQPSLSHLNDDCLLHVFEMVGIVDWIRLSKVSPRFRSIISSKILSRQLIDFGAISRNHSIRKVFRMFGPFAASVKISVSDIQYQNERRSSAEELFHLLAKYCNVGKLRELTLSVDLGELCVEYVDKLGTRLGNLRHISIHSMRKWLRPTEQIDGDGKVLNQLMLHAKKIESIELTNMRLDGELFCDNRLDALQKLSIISCTAIDFNSFYELMQRIGKQVQTFEWKNSTFKDKSSLCQTIMDVCEVVGDCLPNLTVLALEMNYGQSYCQERTSRE